MENKTQEESYHNSLNKRLPIPTANDVGALKTIADLCAMRTASALFEEREDIPRLKRFLLVGSCFDNSASPTVILSVTDQ